MQALLFTAIAILGTAFAPASAPESNPKDNEPMIVRSEVRPGGLELLVANLERENTLVTLTSLDNDKELFRDQIRKRNGYSYTLNLDKLDDGRYLVAVTKNGTTRKQVVLIRNGAAACSDWK